MIFDFHFPLDSFSVPFEDSFWRICKRRLSIHIANIFTNGLVKSHCRQIQAALWLPEVSHLDSEWDPVFKHLHRLHLLCSSPGQALRPSMVFFLSTLYRSPLAETSFLTHLSDFRPTLSCFLLCSYVLQMASRNINRYFHGNLQMLWKTPQLWCVLKISSPRKIWHRVLKPLPALLIDFII